MPTTSDRRRHARTEIALPLRVRWLCDEVSTLTSDLSEDGVYFVLSEPVVVEVSIGGETRRGRLVRVESRTVLHDELGFAVRFDPKPAKPARRRR